MRSKEDYMDYATGAYLRYCSVGCPTRAEYELRIRADVNNRMRLLEPRLIVMRADAAVRASEPILKDVDAWDRTLATFAERNREEVILAVKAVYAPYEGLWRIPNKVVASRVRAFSASISADPGTVYRWLKDARGLFAFYRELTVDPPKFTDYL